jgi:hypothetical protein
MGCLVALFAFTLLYQQLDLLDDLFVVMLILITLINCGAILEQHRWVYQSELIRAATLSAYIGLYRQSISLLLTLLFAVLIVSFIDSIKQKYFRLIYG